MERTRRNRSRGFGCIGRSALMVSSLLFGVAAAGAATPTAETALLLGVDRDGKQESTWIGAVTEHLAHNGESVVDNQRLTTKDRECKGPECLDALAAREHANLILSLSVQSNVPGTFVISGTLYDAGRHLPYQLPRPDVCDCSSAELVIRLGQVADTLFKDYRKRPNTAALVSAQPPTPSGDPSGMAQPALTAPLHPIDIKPVSGGGYFLSPKRKIIAGVVGGLAGAALITSIVLTTVNGNPSGGLCTYDGEPNRPAEPRCILNTKPFYIAGYVASAGLLVGLGLALFLPPTNQPDQHQ